MHPPNLDQFVALDVEIASRTPLVVCAIAVARFEGGIEVEHYQSAIHVTGSVRYSHIHGLTKADLRDAPSWRTVWTQLTGTLAGVETIVAYRAAFDRAATMTMCARHALRMPRLRFVCAAALYESRLGRPESLATALQTLGLPFPGTPHDPLADARAAAALVLKLRALPEKEGPIQLSQSELRAMQGHTADNPATPR